MKKIQNYINGNLRSFSKKELSVEDPSTGDEIAKVVLSSKEDFEKALIVLERVKNIMMKEYRERRAAVERILREKMQK